MRGLAFGILLLIFAVSAASAESQFRGKLSRTRSDLRTLAMALENYRADYGVYPPPSADEQLPDVLFPTPLSDSYKLEYYQPFSRWDNFRRFFLTPIVLAAFYVILVALLQRAKGKRISTREHILISIVLGLVIGLANSIVHSFAEDFDLTDNVKLVPNSAWAGQSAAFNYAILEEVWVLQSVGPDGDRDVPVLMEVLESQDYSLLELNSYDPTNGTVSSGDLFRRRQ